MFRKYDVPKLLKDKERLIDRYKVRNNRYIIFFLVFFVIILIGFLFYKRRENKKIESYRKIIKKLDSNSIYEDISESDTEKIKNDLSKDNIDKISQGLKLLEAENFFTNPKVKKIDIANKIGTNDKFVSMYLNDVLGKSVPNYLKEKRVIYVMNRIREDKDFRKYTLSAMAKEAGFGDSQYMNKAFMEFQGFKPVFFLRQIEKDIVGNS